MNVIFLTILHTESKMSAVTLLTLQMNVLARQGGAGWVGMDGDVKLQISFLIHNKQQHIHV